MIALKEIWGQVSPPRRMALLGVLAVIILGTCAALWWLLGERDALLFGQLRESDAAEITAALDEWKVPYHFTDDGTGIMVPAGQVHPLRMRLVSAGVPKGGHVGFELFDKDEFGVTEFAQRINYQRALQGEIERTIAALPGVTGVRVHLSIRRPGTFLAEERESKASVALSTAPGTTLSAAQVRGIRSLVASAVDGLAPGSVVVVGPGGLQLAGGSDDADTSNQDENSQRLGAYYEAQIRKVLAAFAGGEDAAVSVNPVLNFDKVRTTSERLLASGAEPGLVTRRSSNTDRTPEGAAGLVNEQVEYAHGTQTEEVTRAAARLERLGVAIVLSRPMPNTDQDRLRRLVAAAVGADPARGDSIEIGVRSGAAAPIPQTKNRPADAPMLDAGLVRREGKRPSVPVVILGLIAALVGALCLVIGYGWGHRRALLAARARLGHDQGERAVQQIRAWIAEPRA
ncbi:MAG TPA: flagellar basal-body MS-ring/collar protein FliF [Stenotrophomonas sp.]|nr:flagellar basal-body MS-ring/collar protein FliF [Stenotrophomonas sp.]